MSKGLVGRLAALRETFTHSDASNGELFEAPSAGTAGAAASSAGMQPAEAANGSVDPAGDGGVTNGSAASSAARTRRRYGSTRVVKVAAPAAVPDTAPSGSDAVSDGAPSDELVPATSSDAEVGPAQSDAAVNEAAGTLGVNELEADDAGWSEVVLNESAPVAAVHDEPAEMETEPDLGPSDIDVDADEQVEAAPAEYVVVAAGDEVDEPGSSGDSLPVGDVAGQQPLGAIDPVPGGSDIEDESTADVDGDVAVHDAEPVAAVAEFADEPAGEPSADEHALASSVEPGPEADDAPENASGPVVSAPAAGVVEDHPEQPAAAVVEDEIPVEPLAEGESADPAEPVPAAAVVEDETAAEPLAEGESADAVEPVPAAAVVEDETAAEPLAKGESADPAESLPAAAVVEDDIPVEPGVDDDEPELGRGDGAVSAAEVGAVGVANVATEHEPVDAVDQPSAASHDGDESEHEAAEATEPALADVVAEHDPAPAAPVVAAAAAEPDPTRPVDEPVDAADHELAPEYVGAADLVDERTVAGSPEPVPVAAEPDDGAAVDDNEPEGHDIVAEQAPIAPAEPGPHDVAADHNGEPEFGEDQAATGKVNDVAAAAPAAGPEPVVVATDEPAPVPAVTTESATGPATAETDATGSEPGPQATGAVVRPFPQRSDPPPSSGSTAGANDGPPRRTTTVVAGIVAVAAVIAIVVGLAMYFSRPSGHKTANAASTTAAVSTGQSTAPSATQATGMEQTPSSGSSASPTTDPTQPAQTQLSRWAKANLSPAAIIVADSAAAKTLRADGFTDVIRDTSTTTDWHTVAYLIRDRNGANPSAFRTRLAAASAPLALFGKGANEITVSEVHPELGTGLAAKVKADQVVRKQAGTELVKNPMLTFNPSVQPAVKAGELDIRAASFLVQLARTTRVAVIDIVCDSGETRAGRPCRTIVVSTGDMNMLQQTLSTSALSYKPINVTVIDHDAVRLQWIPAIVPVAGG